MDPQPPSPFPCDPPGPPDLSLGGLAIWILGRPFENSDDGWSDEALDIAVRFRSEASYVITSETYLYTWEIHKFRTALTQACKSPEGTVFLHPLDNIPNIDLKFLDLGKIAATIEICPFSPDEEHAFHIEIDQSYLPALIRDCDRILERYPLRRPLQA